MGGFSSHPILTLRSRRRVRRALSLLAILCLLWSAIEVTLIRRHLDQHHHHPPHSHDSERIFIASIHWNNEFVLRTQWNQAVTDLVRTLGPHNVYVSVFESGSYDNTKAALGQLEEMLAGYDVPRNITLSDVTHEDEINSPPAGSGWIDTPRDRTELRRIPYLARLRNISLQPLIDLADQGVYFDKVLFLNDVVFTTHDVLELLDTHGGKYAAACSLDFSHPPLYYDTFALRDMDQMEPVIQTWPYFGSSASRGALMRMDAVPVTSCWNGMVAMPASPFTRPANPLRFRGIPDSLAKKHVEGSECCLIHADNPLSRKSGVYLNPRVRVGYHKESYDAVHPERRWLSSWSIWQGLWAERLRRWSRADVWRIKKVRKRVAEWESEDGGYEPGEFCLVDEMQVLDPHGWKHV